MVIESDSTTTAMSGEQQLTGFGTDCESRVNEGDREAVVNEARHGQKICVQKRMRDDVGEDQ